MFSYFKANDPYRLLGAFLLLIIIRVIILWSGVPLIIPELKWLVVGEKLNQEGVMMYRDVWDNMAPLSAFIYKSIDFLFGRSRLVYQIVSVLLVAFQATIFNNLMLRNKAFTMNSYVPAVIFVVMMNLFFDFLTLSPAMISMTFVLLALNNLLQRMDNHTGDELFINTGIYLGIASLIHMPSILYVIVTFITLILYTGTIFRRMILLLFGIILVFALSALYFFWHDNLPVYNHHYFKSFLTLKSSGFIPDYKIAIMMICPLLILVISIYQTFKWGKFINFQNRIQSVMLMFLVASFLAFLISKDRSSFQLIYFVPPLAFFVSHSLLVIRNWLLAEMGFTLIVVLIIVNHMVPLKGWFLVDQSYFIQDLIVKPSKHIHLIEEKSILVLGGGTHHYQNASLATPYFNAQLSAFHLENLDFYDTLSEVFINLTGEFPEVIIDEKKLVPVLFEKIPILESQYKLAKGTNDVYLLNQD